MQVKNKLLKPKIDVVFHTLFKEGNEGITKAIIEAITKEKIESIDLNKNRHIIGKHPEEKLGILDLKATLNNGTICNIEIQLADNKDTAERFLFYWSRIYSSQLIKGDDYAKLNKVIGIIIIDYNLEKTKEIEELSTKWKVKEVSTGKEIELTDVLELYIIEIPKAREMLRREPKNELAQWVMFLNDPNESEVSKIMEDNKEIKIIYLSPRGKILNYELSKSIADSNYNYILICGHYEGIDERIIEKYNIEEISIGDYVLTGGELASQVLIDSVVRLIPGVIDEGSLIEESHTNYLLEYPQYTKPDDFCGMMVPDILKSGNHKKIEEFRKNESIRITKKYRPDLLEKYKKEGK